MRPVGLQHGYRNYECLAFANLSPKTATRVRFKFMYFDAARENVGSGELERTGSFATGIVDQGPPNLGAAGLGTFDPGTYNDCLAFTFPHQGIAINVVMVERVEYSDGTAWERPTPQPSATPAVAPTATVEP